jgi:hypothetical protein
MTSANHPTPTLFELEFIPYISADGQLPDHLSGTVGLYAIFDAEKTLQFVGYSRDIYLSLQQHLVRCPQDCHWVKVEAVSRPSRTVLEEMRQAWLEAQDTIPPGNQEETSIWTQPVDAKAQMTSDERAAYESAAGELERSKLLKRVARRVEAKILAVLNQRGLQTSIRFDPKLKEQGLLSVKP